MITNAPSASLCVAGKLENLAVIEEKGVRAFIMAEKEKWKCPECGQYFCVHRPACLNCGTKI